METLISGIRTKSGADHRWRALASRVVEELSHGMSTVPGLLFIGSALIAFATEAPAQFRDDFNGPKTDGWFTMAGDGDAKVEFVQMDGFARMAVDSTPDRTGVWWTIIKRDVTASLDLAKLADPAYELRVEARVRPSHAPRRVNFMLNTDRTTDFHEHLREYDLADASGWHVISMTTRDFDARPGDTVFVQLGVTDWGPGKFHLDIDYYRADVVRRDEAAPDLGEPLVYHPEVPPVSAFVHHLGVTHDSVLNKHFPDVNFNDWHVAQAGGDPARVLTVNGDQWIALRWDFGSLKRAKAKGAGVLELTTHSLAFGGDYVALFGKDLGEEFGKIRVIEILGGDPEWDQRSVTLNSLMSGREYEDVFNLQMTIDLELAAEPGGKAWFTLPRPVMQRLLDGTTKGLLIRQLGALSGTIYASEDASGRGPVLHFNTRSE
jgi:hypothetical protein